MFKDLEKILISVGVSNPIELTKPPKSSMGDFAYACFDYAKQKNIDPITAAKQIADTIQPNQIVKEVKAFGPYVNFFLNPKAIHQDILINVIKSGDKFGQKKINKDKKVLVEYPSNNTHKELHIGHLRNICIGNSLVRIFEYCGEQVIPVNYVNDYGAHVAKCLWGLKHFHKSETPPKNKQKWLGQIYAEASQYLKDHPEYKNEIQILQKHLEAKDKSIWSLYLKTRKWSLSQFDIIFKQLGVKHKHTFFEKDIKQLGQTMVDNLLKKKIAQVGEGGAIIIDLSAQGLEVVLLRKSDGTGLYLTADLGLALVKNKKYSGISESIHITGTEQNLYFKQLFKVLELAGYKFDMTHIGYGLVNLPTGKMSSREGTVVLYEDVYDGVYNQVYQATASRHTNWSAKKIANTTKLIALAAIKFDFLKHESSKVMVFDAQSAASFDGFTGPYILYTIARINSLLKKSKHKKNKIDFSLLVADEEKQLSLLINEFSLILQKARKNYNPSTIVKYSFDLAKAYNDFYHKHSVLNATDINLVEARLYLSKAVKIVLENSLKLLSIDPVKEM